MTGDEGFGERLAEARTLYSRWDFDDPKVVKLCLSSYMLGRSAYYFPEDVKDTFNNNGLQWFMDEGNAFERFLDKKG